LRSLARELERGLPINAPTAGHCRAMPLNIEHLFLISPELKNQFISISLLTPPRRVAHRYRSGRF
jgi:hypothetical protein